MRRPAGTAVAPRDEGQRRRRTAALRALLRLLRTAPGLGDRPGSLLVERLVAPAGPPEMSFRAASLLDSDEPSSGLSGRYSGAVATGDSPTPGRLGRWCAAGPAWSTAQRCSSSLKRAQLSSIAACAAGDTMPMSKKPWIRPSYRWTWTGTPAARSASP